MNHAELEKLVNALVDEVYIQNERIKELEKIVHPNGEEYTSTVVDGTRIWHPKGETL